MASIGNLTLHNGVFAATGNTDSKSLSQEAGSFIGVLTIANWVAGTYTVLLQHSADGVNWATFDTFAALGANGFEIRRFANTLLPNIRASVTVAGGPGNADVKIQLWFDPRG